MMKNGCCCCFFLLFIETSWKYFSLLTQRYVFMVLHYMFSFLMRLNWCEWLNDTVAADLHNKRDFFFIFSLSSGRLSNHLLLCILFMHQIVSWKYYTATAIVKCAVIYWDSCKLLLLQRVKVITAPLILPFLIVYGFVVHTIETTWGKLNFYCIFLFL